MGGWGTRGWVGYTWVGQALTCTVRYSYYAILILAGSSVEEEEGEVAVPLSLLVAIPLSLLVAIPLSLLVAVPLSLLVAIPLSLLVAVPLSLLLLDLSVDTNFV